ncbi:MAG: Cupin 2 conserved barrel domain protein [Rhodoferax sp.]|nr:Cupin 2 conserved barrel domain protein [Rhodoferax sp.]
MALNHHRPHEVIRLAPTDETATLSRALIKTGALELLHIVLPNGEDTPEHAVDAEMTLQCMSGRLWVHLLAKAPDDVHVTLELEPGDLVVVAPQTRYALQSVGLTTALQTMVLPFGGSASATSPGAD